MNSSRYTRSVMSARFGLVPGIIDQTGAFPVIPVGRAGVLHRFALALVSIGSSGTRSLAEEAAPRRE